MSSGAKICPECGEVYDVDAQVCGMDGTSLITWKAQGKKRALASQAELAATHSSAMPSGE